MAITKKKTIAIMCITVVVGILSQCTPTLQLTDEQVGKLETVFGNMKFTSFSTGDALSSPVEDVISGAGSSKSPDGTDVRYKWAVLFDGNGEPTVGAIGSTASQSIRHVALTKGQTRDQIRLCSAVNAGQPASSLFECMDAVMATATRDCDAALRDPNMPVAQCQEQCWWQPLMCE